MAFRLGLNRWQGQENLQLEVVALRPGSSEAVVLRRRQRTYWCERQGEGLRVRNADGVELCWQPFDAPGASAEGQHPYVRSLLQEAALALGLGCCGAASEGAAAVEEDEDHGRPRQGDQGQGSEVGDQVKVDAHGASARAVAAGAG